MTSKTTPNDSPLIHGILGDSCLTHDNGYGSSSSRSSMSEVQLSSRTGGTRSAARLRPASLTIGGDCVHTAHGSLAAKEGGNMSAGAKRGIASRVLVAVAVVATVLVRLQADPASATHPP